MCKARCTRFILGVLFAFGPTLSDASVIWDWSANSGQERGTFETDGNVVGGTLPADTYIIQDFTVLATSITALTSLIGGSISGGQFTAFAPDDGLIWDGSAITQFFRNGSTNGSVFYTVGGPFGDYDKARWIFNVGDFLRIDDPGDNRPSVDFSDQSTTPRVSVPEPWTVLLLGLGSLGLAWTRRKRP